MPPKQAQQLEVVGTGKFIFENGSTYEGEYGKLGDKLVRHGKGVYREALARLDPDRCPGLEPEAAPADSPAQIFDGTWDQDRFVEGKICFPDGSYFEGTLDEHGFYDTGKYVFADKSTWEGPYRDCRMAGEGVFTDAAGRKWRGVMADSSCSAMAEIRA